MLKRAFTYEDYNGDTVTETLYFNLSKPELIELEVEFEGGGFGKMLERIIETQNSKELIKQFKRIILMAYGEKSDDGKRFIKSDAIREAFSQTAAYEALFMEMATDDGAAVIFLKAILPKDIIDAAADQDKPKAVTTAPTPEG